MLKTHLFFLKNRAFLISGLLILSVILPVSAQSRFDELNKDLSSFGVPFIVDENDSGQISILYTNEAVIDNIVSDYTRLLETLRFLDSSKGSLSILGESGIVFILEADGKNYSLNTNFPEFRQFLDNNKARKLFLEELKNLMR